MPYVKPKIASETLGITVEALRNWARQGKVKTIIGIGGHRLYDIDSIINPKTDNGKQYIYCRVSSNKQKEDLERQVNYLSEKYPDHEVFKEIASGINFKRKVLQRILEEVFRGNVKRIVVAHRDRLCRIAWEHFFWLCEKFGTTIVVDSNEDHSSPETELAEDLMSIVHVFSCRHYGARRKYTRKTTGDNSEQTSSETEQSENSENKQSAIERRKSSST